MIVRGCHKRPLLPWGEGWDEGATAYQRNSECNFTDHAPSPRPSPHGRGSRYLPALFIALILTGCGTQELSGDEKANLLYSLVLLTFVGSGFLAHYRHRLSHAALHAIAWIGIFCLIILGYSFRNDLHSIKNRLMGEIQPSLAMQNDDGALTFRMASDGHFHIEAKVNGYPVEFLVDTGASDVVIPASIAPKLGINTDTLEYTRQYNTANGTIYGAPIRLARIEVGGIILNDIRASISKSGLSTPLLGMSFMNELSGFEVRGDTLKVWK